MPEIRDSAAKLNAAAFGVKKVLEKNRAARQAQPKIAAFFREQKDLTIDRLKGLEPFFTEEQPAKTSKAAPVPQAVAEAWDSIWKDIDRETFDNLQTLVKSVESDSMLKGAAFGNNQIGSLSGRDLGQTFSLKNPRAVKWFQDNGGSVKYIKGIQDTTKDQVQTIITRALDTGQSYNKTAKEISDAFDGMSRDRAQTIAVYETAQAYEEGNRQFADTLKDEGVEVEKFYQTSEDDRVSELCRGNQNDGWIPLNETHSSGVQQPPGHIKCRCFEMYREKGQD